MSYFDPEIYCPHNIKSETSKAYMMGMLHFVSENEYGFSRLEALANYVADEMIEDEESIRGKIVAEIISEVLRHAEAYIRMETVEACVGIIESQGEEVEPFTDADAEDGAILEPMYSRKGREDG